MLDADKHRLLTEEGKEEEGCAISKADEGSYEERNPLGLKCDSTQCRG